MMMFQSKFVFEIFTGHAVSWNTQNRDDEGTSFRDAFSRHIWHTLLGIVTTIVVGLYAQPLFWWMLPITTGLMLSIPISMFTSREKAGLWFKKHHYFLIPEETKIPHIIRAAKKYKEALVKTKEKSYGADLIIRDSVLNALHILMLPINGPAPNYRREDLEKAQVKIENYINHGIEPDLSKDEEIALLYAPEILSKARTAWSLNHQA